MGFGAINVENIGSIFSGAGDLLKSIREIITGKTILDQNAVMQIQEKLAELDTSMMNAQASINLAEAQNPKLFISGWRPSVGWLASLALAMNYVIFPLATWILPIVGHPDIKLPQMDVSALYPLLMALLGVGTMRTVEKIQGVQDKH
jgi:hypothetical protein